MDRLLAEVNRCVSCGLCLPHCPTYRLTMSEADSPRGRIALMNGVATGKLPMNTRFVEHMDRCLTCRACEAVCPNNVAYGELIDAARVMIVTSSHQSRNGAVKVKKSWLRKLVTSEFIAKPWRFDQLRAFFRLIQKFDLLQYLQESGLLGAQLTQLAAQVPSNVRYPYVVGKGIKTTKSWQTVYPAVGKQRGSVGLFLGCIARLADVETLNSAIIVLNRLGYTVHVPSKQTCCGALHQHSGDVGKAMNLMQQNKNAFRELNLSNIVTTASGCGVQLAGYDGFRTRGKGHHVKENETGSNIIDINKFLALTSGWGDIDIMPLLSKVAVQDPCSMRNVLRDQAHVYTLLAHIPEIQIVPLSDNDQCCGAAGTYFIDQPEFARKLQAEKISALSNNSIRYLVTSNIGCSLYIASGLRVAKSPIEVLHPVTLIARQMGIQ